MLKKWCSAVALFVFVQGIFDGRGHTIYGLNAENSIVVSNEALLREATMWMALSLLLKNAFFAVPIRRRSSIRKR